MSYNQKPTGQGSASGGGIAGSAPNGPNNQTSQHVAKTLAGIQQQMQNLVHGSNPLPQAATADLNAFIQQQRFQSMFKQQQQQLLQQHIQQIQQQQNKDRAVSGSEPLALTRTPAAAELLNKTFQPHHQQQANGSTAANPTLASVNQQIQQQLQAFPPNIMQQIQAFQYQMQQQQQQHPQQQHLAQPSLQQAHQQSQPGQHQTPQHQAGQQHGQTHQQQQKALTTAAAAHMQQLQQSLQQKYLSVAAAANQLGAGANKMNATSPPPPLTNQIKPPNLPSSTQITPLPTAPATVSISNTISAKSSLPPTLSPAAPPASVKQVPPSISLAPLKPATSQTSPAPYQQNKVVLATNKPVPMVSAISPPFTIHYQKSQNTASSESAKLTSSSVQNVNSENSTAKTHQTEALPLNKQQQAATVDLQLPRMSPSTSSLLAAAITKASQVVLQNKAALSNATMPSIKQESVKDESTNVSTLKSPIKIKDIKTPEDASKESVADKVSLEVTLQPEENAQAESNDLTPTSRPHAAVQETSTAKDVGPTDVAKVELDNAEVSSVTSDRTEQACTDANKDKEPLKNQSEEEIVTTNDEVATTKEIATTKESTATKDEIAVIKDEIAVVKDEIAATKNEVSAIETTVVEEDSKENPSIERNLDSGQKNNSDLHKTESPLLIEEPNKISMKSAPQVEARVEETHTITEETVENVTINAAIENIAFEEPDNIVEVKTTIDYGISNENPVQENQISNEEKITEKEIIQENIVIAPNPVERTESVINLRENDVEEATVSENASTSTETPIKKHGRPSRASKAHNALPNPEKIESLQKRGVREDRRSSKQNPEVSTETSSTSTVKETQKSIDRKSQRHRLKTILYQSPLPELAYITKLSASEASNSPKPMSVEDKLIVFYRNEYMAVRNAEGTFYLCQTMQNVYRTSPRIRIRWLSEDKKDSTIFVPDFYDHTDIECVLTTVELKRVEKGQLRLPKSEKARIESILKRAIDVENGLVPRPDITEENPDGLDISLYKDESQIEKKSTGSTPSSYGRRKRRGGGSPSKSSSVSTTENKLKRGNTSGTAKSKSPKKKRKTFARKKESESKASSDEDVTSDEESDTEYKPNQKRNTSITSKSPRAQRSPLAKARAASPITPTSNVPQANSSSVLTKNNRTGRSNKRKSTTDISAETPTRKLVSGSVLKSGVPKSKVDGSFVETTSYKKPCDAAISANSDNNPSTSADATAAAGLVSAGTRAMRNRK